jgi:23S rRNA (cytidine2498-2'-O)-methyltransferase
VQIPFSGSDFLFSEMEDLFPRNSKRRIGNSVIIHGVEGEPRIFWAENIWRGVFTEEFASINEAAQILRARGKLYAPVLHDFFRRGALIQQKLIPVSTKKRELLWTAPASRLGAWTLLSPNRLLASTETSSPFPGGRIEFLEDKSGPPSRAYLKLAEAIARLGFVPGPGDTCLDAGASPGGWTWLLARAGAGHVTAVDRAPLDPKIAALPRVCYLARDAFNLKPADLGPVDLLLCDAAVYPERLFRWIEAWLESGLAKRYICTLKMQGAGDMETVRKFASISGSRVVHLCHNKHELTWML